MEETLEELRKASLVLGIPEAKRKTMTKEQLRTYALDELCKTIGGSKGVDERLPVLRKECLEWETLNNIREQHERASQGMAGAKALRDKLCREACSIAPFSSMLNVSPDSMLNLAVYADEIDMRMAEKNASHPCMKWKATLLRQELDGIERCLKVAETLAATATA